MDKTIITGTAIFVLLNLAAGATYAALWPMLDSIGLLGWSFSDGALWLEIGVHAIILALIGAVFCKWFAGRIRSEAALSREFE